MKIFISTIVLLNLYSSIRFLVGIAIEKIASKSLKIHVSAGKKNNYIFMPVYKEEEIIQETIDYFISFIPSNTKLVLITTDKELNSNRQNPTLDKITQKIVKDKIILINYPFKTGNKGDQLNYGLKELECVIKEKDYLVLYDVDSRPDKETFNIIEKMKSEDKKIIQQNSIFSSSKDNFIGTIEAICETRWSIGFEKLNQRINENDKLRKILVPYAYCVGHGLFIRRDVLKEVGDFPTPNEDVPLGLLLNLTGKIIYSVDTFDYCEVKEDFKSLYLQQGNWIKAAFISFYVLKTKLLDSSISIYRKLIFFIRSCMDVLSWFQYLILLICIPLDFFVLKAYVGIYLIDLCSLFLVKSVVNKKEYSSAYIFGYPIREVIRGLSLISYIYQKNKGWYYDE